MDTDDLKRRTKQFAIRVIKLVEALPNTRSAYVIGNQLLRAGTSVGANYRAACRGRSKPEFIAKLGIALEEADETYYWMELLIDANIMTKNQLAPLMAEADEITAILTASVKTARTSKNKKSQS